MDYGLTGLVDDNAVNLTERCSPSSVEQGWKKPRFFRKKFLGF